jgi:hypothetical protein
MYRLLQQAGVDRPVAGNQDGSYLTLKSNCQSISSYAETRGGAFLTLTYDTDGLVFMIIQITSGFGTVMLDQGYWQRAIASKAETAVRAYLMGGFAW